MFRTTMAKMAGGSEDTDIPLKTLTCSLELMKQLWPGFLPSESCNESTVPGFGHAMMPCRDILLRCH